LEVERAEGRGVAGGNGSGNGLHQLHSPRTLLLEPSGTLLIGDAYNHRIVRWQLGAERGELVAGGNGTGAKLNQIARPYGIAFDADGELYVSDYLNHRVMRWNHEKGEGEVVAGGRGSGIDPDCLHGPCGITFDPFNRLLVADAANHRIMQFQMDDRGRFLRDGEVVAGGNDAGPRLNQLSWPHNISINSEGHFLIADHMNHRIMHWVPGAASGRVVAGDNGIGDKMNQLT